MEKISDNNYEDLIKNTKILIVKFEADWCGPCKMLSPILEEISNDYGDKIKVVSCNVDENPKSASKFSIRNIPTVLFFKAGELKTKYVGVGPKKTFETEINKLL